MPEISRLYGIVVRMFLIDREHPPRHIHIKYGEYLAVMELDNLNIVEGGSAEEVPATRQGVGGNSPARAH